MIFCTVQICLVKSNSHSLEGVRVNNDDLLHKLLLRRSSDDVKVDKFLRLRSMWMHGCAPNGLPYQ